MNERIRELAEQADDFTDNKIQMHGEYHPDWHDIRDQKFAELIVKDTIDLLTQEWYNLNNAAKANNEGPREVGIRVGAKSQLIKMIEKVKTHFNA